MNEHPILFSVEMVQAILDGRKTQTRRVVKFNNIVWKHDTGQVQTHYEYKACYPLPAGGFVFWSDPVGQAFSDCAYKGETGGYRCPYGEPGDRLWVRETWQKHNGYIYAADFTRDELKQSIIKWRPSIFMPRDASRITLEIVNVRVERLQDISEQDALYEGVTRHMRTEFGYSVEESQETFNFTQARSTFKLLWNSINSARGFGWDVNPWVWVVEFRLL